MGLFDFKPLETGDFQASVTLKGIWLRGVPETPQSHIHVIVPPEQALDLLGELLRKRDTLLRGLHPDINLLAYPCPNCQEPIRLRTEAAWYSGECRSCGEEVNLNLKGEKL